MGKKDDDDLVCPVCGRDLIYWGNDAYKHRNFPGKRCPFDFVLMPERSWRSTIKVHTKTRMLHQEVHRLKKQLEECKDVSTLEAEVKRLQKELDQIG